MFDSCRRHIIEVPTRYADKVTFDKEVDDRDIQKEAEKANSSAERKNR